MMPVYQLWNHRLFESDGAHSTTEGLWLSCRGYLLLSGVILLVVLIVLCGLRSPESGLASTCWRHAISTRTNTTPDNNDAPFMFLDCSYSVANTPECRSCLQLPLAKVRFVCRIRCGLKYSNTAKRSTEDNNFVLHDGFKTVTNKTKDLSSGSSHLALQLAR